MPHYTGSNEILDKFYVTYRIFITIRAETPLRRYTVATKSISIYSYFPIKHFLPGFTFSFHSVKLS